MSNIYLKHAHLAERQFRRVLKVYCADVGGLTASKLTRLNKNTAHRLFGLLRARVLKMAEGETAALTGGVQVGESYFGPRRVRGRRGLGSRIIASIMTTMNLPEADVISTALSPSGATPNCAWQNFEAFAGSTSMTTSKKPSGASIIAAITSLTSSSLSQ